jgi:hypothetical protein
MARDFEQESTRSLRGSSCLSRCSHCEGSGSNPGHYVAFFRGKKGTRTGFSPSTLVYFCQYYSTSASYSFIPISLTL